MKKIEYVKRGIVGVCAATLLTGLCAGAAFAAGTEGVTDAGAAADHAAGSDVATAITAKTSTAQINATVPTAVTAHVKGDGTLTFPASTDFKISVTAGNEWPMKISKLAVAPAAGFNLVDTAAADKDIALTLGGKALKAANNATDANSPLAGFAQTTTDAQEFPIVMAGNVKGVSYDQAIAASGLSLVTLTWTIGVV